MKTWHARLFVTLLVLVICRLVLQGQCIITCPQNITVQLGPGQCNAVVSYNVHISGNCIGGIVQSSGYSSGSLLSSGIYQNCFFTTPVGGGEIVSCCFTVTVIEYSGPVLTALVCNDLVNVSLDQNCQAAIGADQLLEGGPYKCYDDYIVNVSQYGTLNVNDDLLNYSIGNHGFTVTDPETGNFCFGNMIIEDKLPPFINCANTVTSCSANPNTTGIAYAVDNCTNPCPVSYVDDEFDSDCNTPPGIHRTWTATDASGNTAQCLQTIYIQCPARLIEFSNVGSSQMTVRWSNGNGDKRILKINTSSSFTAPNNGSDPSANSHYNTNGPTQQVVYNDIDNQVTVTGLAPNTTYWFRVYEAYCSGSNTYYVTSPALNNPNSQKTLAGPPDPPDPSSVVPNMILAPVPCTANPPFYQSVLPETLYNADLDYNPCIPLRCDNPKLVWRGANGMELEPDCKYSDNSTCNLPTEVLPFASTCFPDNDYTWEFRQRGYITGCNDINGNNACGLLSCKKDCLSPSTLCQNKHISHYSCACWGFGDEVGMGRDDRRAWDIRYMTTQFSEVKVCVFAVFGGIVVGKVAKQSLLIKHPDKDCVQCWYSLYENIEPSKNVNDMVYEGEHIGHIKSLNGPHLHFGVYYKTSDEKYMSVDRPFKPNDKDASDNDFTISNFDCKLIGSTIRRADFSYKQNNTWYNATTPDETGRISLSLVPGFQNGDSIKIAANGYLPLLMSYDSAAHYNFNHKISLFKQGTDSTVFGPFVQIVPNQIYYSDPLVNLGISALNADSFSIVSIKLFEDGAEYSDLASGTLGIDTTVAIALPEIGQNNIGIKFFGIDSTIVIKKLIYLPQVDSIINLTILSDSSFLFTDMYINGQFYDQILQTNESFDFPSDKYQITFRRYGYYDNEFVIFKDTTHVLDLMPLPSNRFSSLDSTIFDFTFGGHVKYYKNISIYDSSHSNIIKLKQFDQDFTELALNSKTRSILFQNLSISSWKNVMSYIVLDQPEYLSEKDIYLLQVIDDSVYHKLYFDRNYDIIRYDSVDQKISISSIDFNQELVHSEAIVLMTKQQPRKLPLDTLRLRAMDSIVVPLTELFSDPDSLPNDMTFSLPDSIPQGVEIIIENGNLLIMSNTCSEGVISFEVIAEHDELLVSNDIIVAISPRPTLEVLITGETEFCAGDSVLLSAETANSYSWNTGETTQVITASMSGEFVVTITDENGCTASSEPVIVTVHTPEVPEITAVSGAEFCEGDSVILSSSLAVLYNWSTGDTIQDITVSMTKVITVTVTDENGCTASSAPVQITEHSNPIVDLGPDTIMTSMAVVLDAENPGAMYVWNTMDSTQTILADTTGKYSVVVTDINGCLGQDSIYIEIITNVVKLDDFGNVLIYPNPNSGVFTVEIEGFDDANIGILVSDLTGRTIHLSESRHSGGKFLRQIDLSAVPSGAYHVRISTGARMYSGSIMIQR